MIATMEQALEQLGLNAKEVKFYLFLLREGQKTGSELAKELRENRTNTYMVLNKLAKDGLVESNDDRPVRRYSAADPERLKALVIARQQQIRQAHSSLSSVLPELGSLFSLSQHKPGVVYFEGLAGYKAFQEDIVRSGSALDVLASDVVPENEEALAILEQEARKRTAKARIIFHSEARNQLDMASFAARGYDVRFWGDTPLIGEIAIYSNKVGITAYESTLITTVITNDIIAETFRIIFKQLWAGADSKPLSSSVSSEQ